jgi:hypothetical protein
MADAMVACHKNRFAIQGALIYKLWIQLWLYFI